jgi:hypothetical protein
MITISHSLNDESCQDLLATHVSSELARISMSVPAPEVNNKLRVVPRNTKPALNPRTKVGRDEKVSDRP